MSEVVSRMLQVAGEVGRPSLKVVALAKDDARGALLHARLAADGCEVAVEFDAASAIRRLSESEGYSVLVGDFDVTRPELEAIARNCASERKDAGSLTIIHLANDVQEPVETRQGVNHYLQTVRNSELSAALAEAAKAAALRGGELQRQLEVIARAVIRLGQQLQSFKSKQDELRPAIADPEDAIEGAAQSLDSEQIVTTLRRLIRSRRLRERYFPEARFGEPAWDILLDLSLAWFEDKALSVSSVCIASGVPMSTAMRWINEMVEAGMIERWVDPTDARRNLVRIAPETRGAMLRYLSHLARAEGNPDGSSQNSSGEAFGKAS